MVSFLLVSLRLTPCTDINYYVAFLSAMNVLRSYLRLGGAVGAVKIVKKSADIVLL